MKKREEKINKLLDDLIRINKEELLYDNLVNKQLKDINYEELKLERINIIKLKLDKLR